MNETSRKPPESVPLHANASTASFLEQASATMTPPAPSSSFPTAHSSTAETTIAALAKERPDEDTEKKITEKSIINCLRADETPFPRSQSDSELLRSGDGECKSTITVQDARKWEPYYRQQQGMQQQDRRRRASPAHTGATTYNTNNVSPERFRRQFDWRTRNNHVDDEPAEKSRNWRQWSQKDDFTRHGNGVSDGNGFFAEKEDGTATTQREVSSFSSHSSASSQSSSSYPSSSPTSSSLTEEKDADQAKTYYLVIDIETSGPSMVANFMPCFGAAFIEVETCRVLEQRLFWIAQPKGTVWDAETVRTFWNTPENCKWYRDVLDRLSSKTLPTMKETMNEFVDWVQGDLYARFAESHRSHNNVIQLVSDNPSYDLGWLSYYLTLGTDNRVPHVQYLLNNRYNGHPLDTRSFCDGVRRKLHGPSFTRSARFDQPKTVTQVLRVGQWKRRVLGALGVRYDHNPKHDAVVIGVNAAVVACALADSLRRDRRPTSHLAQYDRDEDEQSRDVSAASFSSSSSSPPSLSASSSPHLSTGASSSPSSSPVSDVSPLRLLQPTSLLTTSLQVETQPILDSSSLPMSASSSSFSSLQVHSAAFSHDACENRMRLDTTLANSSEDSSPTRPTHVLRDFPRDLSREETFFPQYTMYRRQEQQQNTLQYATPTTHQQLYTNQWPSHQSIMGWPMYQASPPAAINRGGGVTATANNNACFVENNSLSAAAGNHLNKPTSTSIPKKPFVAKNASGDAAKPLQKPINT